MGNPYEPPFTPPLEFSSGPHDLYTPNPGTGKIDQIELNVPQDDDDDEWGRTETIAIRQIIDEVKQLIDEVRSPDTSGVDGLLTKMIALLGIVKIPPYASTSTRVVIDDMTLNDTTLTFSDGGTIFGADHIKLNSGFEVLYSNANSVHIYPFSETYGSTAIDFIKGTNNDSLNLGVENASLSLLQTGSGSGSINLVTTNITLGADVTVAGNLDVSNISGAVGFIANGIPSSSSLQESQYVFGPLASGVKIAGLVPTSSTDPGTISLHAANVNIFSNTGSQASRLFIHAGMVAGDEHLVLEYNTLNFNFSASGNASIQGVPATSFPSLTADAILFKGIVAIDHGRNIRFKTTEGSGDDFNNEIYNSSTNGLNILSRDNGIQIISVDTGKIVKIESRGNAELKSVQGSVNLISSQGPISLTALHDSQGEVYISAFGNYWCTTEEGSIKLEAKNLSVGTSNVEIRSFANKILLAASTDISTGGIIAESYIRIKPSSGDNMILFGTTDNHKITLLDATSLKMQSSFALVLETTDGNYDMIFDAKRDLIADVDRHAEIKAKWNAGLSGDNQVTIKSDTGNVNLYAQSGHLEAHALNYIYIGLYGSDYIKAGKPVFIDSDNKLFTMSDDPTQELTFWAQKDILLKANTGKITLDATSSNQDIDIKSNEDIYLRTNNLQIKSAFLRAESVYTMNEISAGGPVPDKPSKTVKITGDGYLYAA